MKGILVIRSTRKMNLGAAALALLLAVSVPAFAQTSPTNQTTTTQTTDERLATTNDFDRPGPTPWWLGLLGLVGLLGLRRRPVTRNDEFHEGRPSHAR